jgi:4a-hydroxytetrahydrobiopterin dehydratase
MFHAVLSPGNDQVSDDDGGIAMTAVPAEHAYSDTEVEAWLAANLPHWKLDRGWIRRKYRTTGWKGTMMLVGTIGHLAEAAWHHPDITLSYAWLEVRLCTHTAKGITEKDYALARKIEEVVQWQPGREGGVLEGTPRDDPRFAYIKYD